MGDFNEDRLLKKIKVVFDQSLEVKLEEKLEEKLTEKVGKLPTKEEYYKREDKMMGKLKKIEEELTMLSDHSSNHTDRIEALEKIHPQGKHPDFLQA